MPLQGRARPTSLRSAAWRRICRLSGAPGRQPRRSARPIVRLLLERVLVEVVDRTEQVRVECHWHGGNRTRHQLVRPVARLDALSTYPDLVARAGGLHHEGHGYPEIAEIL